MHFFEVRRTIAAAPETLWRLLTDARVLADGSFGIDRLEGDIRPGGALKLWSSASPGRAFPLHVAEFVPPRRMVWSGGMPLGLFRGVRQFNLTPATGGTEFHMREDYSGLMLGLIWPSIPDLDPSFSTFAEGLVAHAEHPR